MYPDAISSTGGLRGPLIDYSKPGCEAVTYLFSQPFELDASRYKIEEERASAVVA